MAQPRADYMGYAGLPSQPQFPGMPSLQPQQQKGVPQQGGAGGGRGKGGAKGGSFGGKAGAAAGFADRDPLRTFGDKGGMKGGAKGGKGGGKGDKNRGQDKGGAHEKGQHFQSPPPPQFPTPQLTGSGNANWQYGQSTKGGPSVSPGGKDGKGAGPSQFGKGGKMTAWPGYGKGDGMESQLHSNLFVGNLAEGVDQAELQAAFAPFGMVQSCSVNSKSGRAYGFVKFSTTDSANRAIGAMNGNNGWVVKLANRDMAADAGFKPSGKGESFGTGKSDKATHTNVFVGNLNEGTSEAQLEKVFSAYGTVDSCCVMNKNERTYGFVEFSKIEEAEASIKGLDGQSGLEVKFANNDRVPVSWEDAIPHSNLFVGGLPLSTTDSSLRKTCEKFGSVQSCTVKTGTPEEGTSYGFVKFVHTAAARRAIKSLNGVDGWSVKCANHDVAGGAGKGEGGKGDFFSFMGGKGKDIWGGGWVWSNQTESERPEPEPHDNLYVKNLPPGVSEEEITETFAEAGDVVECRVLRWDGVSECAALVRMASIEAATKAKELLNGKVHAKCVQDVTVTIQQKSGAPVEDHCFVKGLHCTTSEEQLKALFGKCGEVKWCRVLPLPFMPASTKLPDCTALVQMANAEEAQKAVDELSGQPAPECGAAMVVRYAEVQSSADRPEPKPNTNLYVKGWPVGFPDFLLQTIFQQHGQVVRLRILENPDPEQPTCAALVQMAREEEASTALKALHRQTVAAPVPPMRVKHAGRDQGPSGNLYVTSLPRTITEQQIRDTFEKFGPVTRLRLLNQEKSPELRALVELSSTELASKAVRELDNTPPVFKGPVLYIQYATRREVAQGGARKTEEAADAPAAAAAPAPAVTV